MNLYYTTTVGYDSPQPNSDRSLGGYKSSTKVVNDDFGNLFDELSVMTMKIIGMNIGPSYYEMTMIHPLHK